MNMKKSNRLAAAKARFHVLPFSDYLLSRPDRVNHTFDDYTEYTDRKMMEAKSLGI